MGTEHSLARLPGAASNPTHSLQMQELTEQDIHLLVDLLPQHIRNGLDSAQDLGQLLEIVLDLGRPPEARYLARTHVISPDEVTLDDIDYAVGRVGEFGGDNRAGIERTLHRISAIRNRNGRVVGLTLRAGRAVYGAIKIVDDLVMSERNVLLLGRPGVGKTTMLREVARVLADDAGKRVIVVDTSNEIAGDGDIPHPGIGHARRMQVRDPSLQHAVMIEAVENHMPEVIIVDEIGTELEAMAARTIAERGVQLVATAHGNSLENLILNPTLSDLIGGIESVTLGDIEARRRRTQKTVQERRAPPTFDILVEIRGWNQVTVHPDVGDVVDRMLRGYRVKTEERILDDEGSIHRRVVAPEPDIPSQNGSKRARSAGETRIDPGPELEPETPVLLTRILPYGVNKGKLEQAIRSTRAPVQLVDNLDHADLVLTIKNYFRRRTDALRRAESRGKPVYVLRKNTLVQIEQFMKAVTRNNGGTGDPRHGLAEALNEAEDAASRVENGESVVSLAPRGSYVRRLQHKIAGRYGLVSSSTGRDPHRRVVFSRG